MATYRFGKHPPKIDYRTLRLADYLGPALALPPTSFENLARVEQNLKNAPVPTLFPVDGNDVYGDCTIAAAAHADTMYYGLDSEQFVPSRQDVVKLYFKLTGGPDTGLNMLTVLDYWRHHNVFTGAAPQPDPTTGDQMIAYVSINPKNHVHVQQAIRLFGGVYVGFQVQQNCVQDFEAHKPWTPGPLTNDGHAVFATDYDQTNVRVLTWGNTQLGSWAWWDDCVDEAYAILPPAAKNSAFDPGFDLAKLQEDLARVAN
jgi:hypothetical protein